MKIGESSEDYLECLVILEASGKIRSVDVAKMMKVSKPSVNKAMSVLKEFGFITQENYGDIKLTESGRIKANEIYYRHRKLRSFLKDVLKVSGEHAEEDACKIEHIISKETFEKLEKFYDEYMNKEE